MIFCMSNRLWRTEKNKSVRNIDKKEVIDHVVFNESDSEIFVVYLGSIVSLITGEKGIIVKLDDARICDDFIKIWWPHKSDEAKRHTLEYLKGSTVIYEGRRACEL